MKMILVNTDYITGKKLEMIGMVRGTMIQSVHLGKDIMNSFQVYGLNHSTPGKRHYEQFPHPGWRGTYLIY